MKARMQLLLDKSHHNSSSTQMTRVIVLPATTPPQMTRVIVLPATTHAPSLPLLLSRRVSPPFDQYSFLPTHGTMAGLS